MTPAQERAPLAVGALISLLLQAVIAPNIHIFGASPDFVLAYVVAIAIANARNAGYIIPFLAGLLYDLMGSGPVGAMAFVCVGITFVASAAFQALDNESLFIPIILIAVSCFLGEFAYGLLMIACGVSVGLADALVYICLPCGLYDTVLSLIAFPLINRFALGGGRRKEMTIIDSRID